MDTKGKFSVEKMALFINSLAKSCAVGINFQNVRRFVLEVLEVNVTARLRVTSLRLVNRVTTELDALSSS